jgi:hypothetical protein
MPFQSEKQRRFLHANHPEIAKRWERDYANGGILDINESKEIIDDGGNEIELTDYNAAFDDPNDLSTGVKSLFRAKEGGNVRLGPHKATDLLVKKTSTGERPKYQPPGHRDSEPSSSGPSGPPGGGATSQGSGRDYSPPPTRAPDFVTGGGGTKTTTTTSTGGDGPGNIHGGPTVKQALQIGALKKSALDFEKEKGGPEYYGLRKTQEIVNKARDDWEKVKNSTNEKLKKKAGRKIIDQLFLGGATFGLSDVIGVMVQGYKQGKAKNEFIAVLNDSIEKYRDLGIPEHSPHTDTLIQKLNQEILDLTQTRDTPDEDPGGDGPIYAPLTGAVDESYAQGDFDYNYGMSDLDRIRAGQAKYAALQDKWEREKVMLANKGGLANLFRVKKQ